MTEYLLNIVGIVLISTILTNVTPQGKTSVLIKNILRLCMYLAILSPVGEFFKNQTADGESKFFQNYFSETVIQTDGDFIQYCSEKSIDEIERALEEKINSDYGLVAVVALTVEEDLTLSNEKEIKSVEISVREISDELKKDIKEDFYAQFQIEDEKIKFKTQEGTE